ncbi:hypothetical protein GIB67_028897 [Kingdonia uniflora]|uniref:BHLH domain-containing protein n=1 Tax=Kingdonia uniflora TaxID=39325 RepID=A0A7J7LTP2_9MAGN|nr:hypothetical protein GIB67_028897 [Kingdonia uniflora]
MEPVQNLLERLRPLVGLNNWDYCVLWKLGEDQRFIHGKKISFSCSLFSYLSEKTQKDGEELVFPVIPNVPCRDMMFQHMRSKNCDLLDQLPSTIPLNSGIYGQSLISNQPVWLNVSDGLNSGASEENDGTRVLVPVAGGLIELFVLKQVPEDPHIVDFVMNQCNFSWEQEAMNTTNNGTPGFNVTINRYLYHDQRMMDDHQPNPFSLNAFTSKTPLNNLQSSISPSSTTGNPNLPWDLPLDQIHLCNSPMNFLGQQFPSSEYRAKNDILFQGPHDSVIPTTAFNSSAECGYNEGDAMNQNMVSTNANFHPSTASSLTKETGQENDSVKQENGRANSVSDCSDQDEDDDYKVGRGGKRHQSKNLVAERKRRKKLNDRLYTLRSLVPKITKMDRASILGDAIEYVKELLKQVKGLQDELEQPLDEDGDGDNRENIIKDNFQLDIFNYNKSATIPEHGESLKMGNMDQVTPSSSNRKITDLTKRTHDVMAASDKSQQMEVQVEMTQINGNEFFLKVFCEHKAGGFVRLMEAMSSLGLEVTNANVTTFRGLVLNVFKVEKRDNEMVQAEYVRDSLLELTRNPTVAWIDPLEAAENADDYHHHHNDSHLHLHSLHLQA